jgi:hypothetical protein
MVLPIEGPEVLMVNVADAADIQQGKVYGKAAGIHQCAAIRTERAGS